MLYAFVGTLEIRLSELMCFGRDPDIQNIQLSIIGLIVKLMLYFERKRQTYFETHKCG